MPSWEKTPARLRHPLGDQPFHCHTGSAAGIWLVVPVPLPRFIRRARTVSLGDGRRCGAGAADYAGDF